MKKQTLQSAAFVLLTISAAVLISPAGARAAQAESAAANKAELLAQFAEYYVPTEVSIASAMENYDRQFMRLNNADANSRILEQKYPGVTANAMQAGRKATEKGLRQSLPAVHKKLSEYMDAHFSANEVAAINVYYGSDSFKAMQNQTVANLNTDGLTDEMLKRAREGDGTLSLDGQQIIAATGEAAMRSMTKEQMSNATKFITSPTGRKFLLNGEGLVAALTTSMSAIMNDLAAVSQTAAMASVQEYITSSNNGTAKRKTEQ